MINRSGKRRRSGRRPLKEMRELIGEALVQLRAEEGVSRGTEGLWFGTDGDTIKNWEQLSSKVSLENVISSVTLGERFLLCVAAKLRKYDKRRGLR